MFWNVMKLNLVIRDLEQQSKLAVPRLKAAESEAKMQRLHNL